MKPGFGQIQSVFGIDWSQYWTSRTPSNLILVVLSTTSISVRWTNGVGAVDGRKIERSEDGVNYSVVGTVTGSGANYKDTGLTTYKKYYYRVREFKGTNYSSYTTVASIMTELYTDRITNLSDTQKEGIYTFFTGLRLNSLTSKVYAAYFPIYSKSFDDWINIFDPRDLVEAFRADESGTVTHDSAGVQGDGATGYFNTNILPSTVLKLNNSHLCVSCITNIAGTYGDFGGVYSANRYDLFLRTATDLLSSTVSTSFSVANTDSRGRYLSVQGATNHFLLKNANKIIDQVNQMTAFPTAGYIVGLCQGDGGGGVYRFSPRKYNYFSTGEAMTEAEGITYDGLIAGLIATFVANAFVPKNSETVSIQSIQGATLKQVYFYYRIYSGANVKLNWGYGADIQLVADGAEHLITSVFPTGNTTYNITLTGDVWKLRQFTLTDQSTITGNISEFYKLSGLTSFSLMNTNLSGSSVGLSSKLTLLVAYNNPNIIWYFDSLSRRLTYLDIDLGSGIDTPNKNSTGLIPNLPPALEYFRIFSHYQVMGGDTTKFPATLTHLDFNIDIEKCFGDLEHLPSGLTYLMFTYSFRPDFSSNITGTANHLPAGLTYLHLTAIGLTVSCNLNLLPSTITELLLEHFGQNMISGDGSNLNPNMTGFGINYCPSTLFSLAVSDIPTTALNWVQVSNCGTVTGNIENISTHLDDALNGGFDPNLTANCPLMFTAVGNGLVYGGGDLPVWRDVTISLDLHWSSAMIDAFLINFASRTQASAKQRQIWIFGTRTSASDAAVATLTGLNKIVTMM